MLCYAAAVLFLLPTARISRELHTAGFVVIVVATAYYRIFIRHSQPRNTFNSCVTRQYILYAKTNHFNYSTTVSRIFECSVSVGRESTPPALVFYWTRLGLDWILGCPLSPRAIFPLPTRRQRIPPIPSIQSVHSLPISNRSIQFNSIISALSFFSSLPLIPTA